MSLLLLTLILQFHPCKMATLCPHDTTKCCWWVKLSELTLWHYMTYEIQIYVQCSICISKWWPFLCSPSRWVFPATTKLSNYNLLRLLANMESGHPLTCSGLTHLEVSLMVSPGFFCLLACSFLIFDYRTVCIYAAKCFFCIPVFCPKLGFYLVLL